MRRGLGIFSRLAPIRRTYAAVGRRFEESAQEQINKIKNDKKLGLIYKRICSKSRDSADRESLFKKNPRLKQKLEDILDEVDETHRSFSVY